MKFKFIDNDVMANTLKERLASLELQYYQAETTIRLLKDTDLPAEELAVALEQQERVKVQLDKHYANAERYLNELNPPEEE